MCAHNGVFKLLPLTVVRQDTEIILTEWVCILCFIFSGQIEVDNTNTIFVFSIDLWLVDFRLYSVSNSQIDIPDIFLTLVCYQSSNAILEFTITY